MAEYLSPGVYVEEFDSGIKAMEGVGTSTAGFVGMAQKGPVKGLPVLITSMADYQRRFGGYLPEKTYGDMRFLPYAVEQFFNNGGSSCYVMRVCVKEQDSTVTDGSISNGSVKAKAVLGNPNTQDQNEDDAAKEAFLTLTAADPGEWGNAVKAEFTLQTKNRTEVTQTTTEASGNFVCEVKDASGYQTGDLIRLQQEKNTYFGMVEKINGKDITLRWQEEGADKLKVPDEEAKKENPLEGDAASVFMYLTEWTLTVGDETASEQYESVSFNPERSNCVEHVLKKSRIVSISGNMNNLTKDIVTQMACKDTEPPFVMTFEGGNDGLEDGKIEYSADMYLGKDGVPDERTGLEAFKTLSDVSIMAIPGITDSTVQSALVSHCEKMGNRFAVLDMPVDKKDVSELQGFRENVDTSYAAMYHPWLQCYDSLAKHNVYLPPSGAIAGIYGRTDNTRGVHKAPANEIVRNCTGLSVNYNEAEQAKLNPKGINLIRALPGQGIRVWGARTCSSDGNWKYVNVRRLFIFIEESIRVNTNWAVFEPNDEMLWSRVEGTIRVFLTTQWRNGALAGATAEEAFFINIGKSTMTEDDILNGRLICVIGVAPVRPAEFVIFRITQKMENAQ